MTTRYVIRSMSTTDYIPAWGQYPKPYHIYLMPSEKRNRAFWTTYCIDVATFDSPHAAEAEAKRYLKDDLYDIVPQFDQNIPTYWELRA